MSIIHFFPLFRRFSCYVSSCSISLHFLALHGVSARLQWHGALLHVRWSEKCCRYRQQECGAVPGVWQALTLALHVMRALSCQSLAHTDGVPLRGTPLPPTRETVEFCMVRPETASSVALCIFGGGEFRCLYTHAEFCFPSAGSISLQTILPVSQWVRGDSPNSLSCGSSQLLAFHLPNRRLMKLCLTATIPWNVLQLHRACQWKGI